MDYLCSSNWLHQEGIDEMRLNLQTTLFELETLKMEANDKSRTHREEMNRLLNLLKVTQQERDEARQQLSQFLFQTPENPNSISFTESNSLSQDGSSSSSPSSSELSSFFNIHPQPLINQEDPTAHNHQLDPLDVLVMGKAFPQSGKLLKAVVEAGPLLQTLLVAGPLPKWINPPPQTQSQYFELPPISFKGSDVNNASGRCDSLSCSGSVKRFGFASSSVIDLPMLSGKKQRL